MIQGGSFTATVEAGPARTFQESRGLPSGLSSSPGPKEQAAAVRAMIRQVGVGCSSPGPNQQPAAVRGPCQAGGNLLQLHQSNGLQLRRPSHVEQEGCLVSRYRRQGVQVWRQCQGNHRICISQGERLVVAQVSNRRLHCFLGVQEEMPLALQCYKRPERHWSRTGMRLAPCLQQLAKHSNAALRQHSPW